jgi:hypothetical protein
MDFTFVIMSAFVRLQDTLTEFHIFGRSAIYVHALSIFSVQQMVPRARTGVHSTVYLVADRITPEDLHVSAAQRT